MHTPKRPRFDLVDDAGCLAALISLAAVAYALLVLA